MSENLQIAMMVVVWCLLLTSMSSGTLWVFMDASNSMMGMISKLNTEMML